MKLEVTLATRRVGVVLLAALPALVVSCAGDKTISYSPPRLTDAQVMKLSPGMSVADVERIYGPLLPGTIPVYAYPAEAGGRYMLYFMPTKEVPSPRNALPLSLVAVTKVDGTSGNPAVGGVYLLPPEVRGKVCNGLADMK